jgi:hypothetical protein
MKSIKTSTNNFAHAKRLSRMSSLLGDITLKIFHKFVGMIQGKHTYQNSQVWQLIKGIQAVILIRFNGIYWIIRSVFTIHLYTIVPLYIYLCIINIKIKHFIVELKNLVITNILVIMKTATSQFIRTPVLNAN